MFACKKKKEKENKKWPVGKKVEKKFRVAASSPSSSQLLCKDVQLSFLFIISLISFWDFVHNDNCKHENRATGCTTIRTCIKHDQKLQLEKKVQQRIKITLEIAYAFKHNLHYSQPPFIHYNQPVNLPHSIWLLDLKFVLQSNSGGVS